MKTVKDVPNHFKQRCHDLDDIFSTSRYAATVIYCNIVYIHLF